MPALPGDKQAAEREPHRQRTAGTWGSERPRQKQHRKADMDEPPAPTKPPSGFPHPKTQRNHSTPTDHSKHSRKDRAAKLPQPCVRIRHKQLKQSNRRDPADPAVPGAKAARPTTPRPCTVHGPPRGGRPHRSRPAPPPATKHQATLHFQTAPAHDAPHCAPPAPVPTKQSHTPDPGGIPKGPHDARNQPTTTKTWHRKTRHAPTPCRTEAPRPAPQKNRCPASSPTQQQHSFHPATDPRARPASYPTPSALPSPPGCPNQPPRPIERTLQPPTTLGDGADQGSPERSV
ncbi:extensin-like [Cyprinodon tularosa]|uniref:extensin-like n=1 Tax=Cyprinodon tularosa TaxID=77115 RepID=UPI0018E20CE7|nr:extensin-like [Cyprinodon tularosa]